VRPRAGGLEVLSKPNGSGEVSMGASEIRHALRNPIQRSGIIIITGSD
jgi:hypothetical protein